MALKPLDKLPEEPLRIQRALLSVTDKSGLQPLAKSLHEAGVKLISTGGTADAIRSAGIPVTDVSELTGFPESFDGRVKTQHPHIHAGLLARTSHAPDNEELEQLGVNPIELVVVNLYPFRETAADPDCTPAIATEQIDIGGPTMIRAAAKNFAHVCVLTDPSQYNRFAGVLETEGAIPFALRKEYARQAFSHTAEYEAAISDYFNTRLFDGENNPLHLNVSLPLSEELRYGENPHQHAAVYGNPSEFIDCFHGKQLSYNNYLDVDSALNLLLEFEDADPTCAILKHTVPCGVATAPRLERAWEHALATDTKSPFGGIVAVNRELDLPTARAIDEIFTEVIIAPSYAKEARDLLQQKQKRRLIQIKRSIRGTKSRQYRSIFGGALSQEPDRTAEQMEDYEVVTDRKPDEREVRDLLFSWKVVKHLKSNAIVYARDSRTIGIGTGQTSRVEASESAVAKAGKEGLNMEQTVVASDAFFPFADGVEAAAGAGATAVIQPGGSIRDDEVIEMANKHDLAMVFTGRRHFRH